VPLSPKTVSSVDQMVGPGQVPTSSTLALDSSIQRELVVWVPTRAFESLAREIQVSFSAMMYASPESLVGMVAEIDLR
jgi:hypothetical protein